MGEIHKSLTKLIASKPHTDAKISDADRNKINLEMQGKRRPVAGSAYAQAIIELARLDPPKPAPPLPLVALDPLWVRDGMFVRSLKSFHGDKRDAARAAGFSCIYVQLDHSGDVGGNIAELHAIGPSLMAQGWRFAGWSTYGQGTDPSADGANHARIRRELDAYLDGWVANGEIWAEGVDAWKSKAWIEAWTANGGFGPVAVSCMSSDNPNYARAFDYPSWLALPGCAVMPQVYGATYPAYTVANGRATMMNGGVPTSRLAMTFDVIQGVGPFADYKTWPAPRSIWTGEDSEPATWVALNR